jgi:hypothetical protein
MLKKRMALVVALGLALPAIGYAQTSAVTATCKDGSAFSGATRSGACRGHGGVKTWGTASSESPSATPAQTGTASTAPAATAPAAKPATRATSTGGPGQVWVNTTSKIYHCPSDRYYGKTKHGEYMSEAQAKSGGFKPDHGKVCTAS